MAQYCRYCSFVYQVDEDKIWCEKKSICLSEKQCKHTNTCKLFDLNPIDVLRQNERGYQPTGIKPVELGGLGKQIKMEEYLNEMG